MTDTLEKIMHEAMAAQRARDERDAQKMGVDLETFLRARELEEAAREKRQRWNDARDMREQRLEPIASRIKPAIYDALVEGRKLKRTPALLAVVEWWLRDTTPILVVHGGVGAGKTVAAAWALMTAGGEYVHCRRQLGERYRPHSWDRSRGVTPLTPDSHHLLVLDDMGTEPRDLHGASVDPRWDEAWNEIADVRQGRRRVRGELVPFRTLITTNDTREDWSKRYGASCADERTADRMGELVKHVVVKTASMRGAA